MEPWLTRWLGHIHNVYKPTVAPSGAPVSGGVIIPALDEADARKQFAAIHPSFHVTTVQDIGPTPTYGEQVGNVDVQGNAVAGTHMDTRHFFAVHSEEIG